MKKAVAILLSISMLLGLTGCRKDTPGIGKDLMEGIPERVVCVNADMEAGAAASADFGVRLFQTVLADGENTLISPQSVLLALSMTANGANGATREEMEQVLGMDPVAANTFLLAWQDSLPESKTGNLTLANGIWFRDANHFTPDRDFLECNANYYQADIYKAAFDEETRKAMNDWVSDRTGGRIPEILDKISPESILYLVNALAFDGVWEEIYREDQVRGGTFTREDGFAETVEMMRSTETEYLEDSLATGFVKYYEGREYAFVALLPKEGVSVSDYVLSLNGQNLRELLARRESVEVCAAMPKFEVTGKAELKEALMELGMQTAFDDAAADFSRMGTLRGEGLNLYISRVLHDTYLAVDERGTKAGAATAVEVKNEGAAIVNTDMKYVTLDRPFVFLLADTQNWIPFFLGTVMTVES